MSINLNVNGNTAPLEAAVQAAVNRIRKTPIKVTVDDKGATQPLGNMKRGADEFSKSMEAANARIIAFGASMAIINGISDAFKAMVTNVVQVEKALADINVVMGLSLANLDKFSDSLFKVAKETAASFDVAAAAATEYARQGLAVEETLKRTKDALILTRLTGMDSANAVKALTAAMNTYGDQIKDTTQLVSKFAAVDVKFAVSAEDFADAISRTGQAAKSAGVDIDELVGLVTAAQQQTARGGKVIGNSFKTIFTRIGRTDTLNQLENLGIAVRDVEGNTIGAKRILTDLANTFDSLTESQKAQIAQTVGGVFQINVLKAVLSDAAKQNGILANATQISAGATDEAIQKNEQLRSTMSAMASETGLALKEVSAKIGELAIAPGMEKILNIVKGFAEGASDMLGDGESSGNKFATGFLKGLGNIITGPGLVVIVAVFGKLFLKAAQYARESLSSLIGVTSEAQKQKAIQTSLVTLFGQNAALSKEMLRTDISRTEKERIILGLLKAQVVEANTLNTIARSSAANLYQKGFGSNLAPRGKPRRTSAQGYIPNYVDAERQQAAQGGYAAGSIRSMNMPGEGSVIYNSAEKVKNFKGMSQPAIMPPKSSKAGENYQQAFDSIHGFDPYAAGGYIPNFAKKTASKTSDIPRNLNSKKLGDLNKDSSLILLTADSSADSESRFFVGKDPKGGTKILNTADLASKRTTGYYQVDVPYYSLDKNDKSRKSKIDLPSIQKAITAAASGKALDIAKQIVGGEKNLKPFNREQIKETFNKGAFKGAAGSAFESAIAAALDSYLFQDYKARTDTSAIDLPYDPKVFQYFGAPPGAGKMGAEVKADLANNLQQGAANKFYQVLAGGRAAWQYKDKNFKDQMRGPTEDAGLERRGGAYFKKGRAYGHIPNFAAARLALTGGLVGKNKFGNIDRRQMTRLVRSNPYFNGLMNEHLTWDSFPKKDKRKLSRWLLKQGVSNRALQAYGLASMHSKSIGEGISSLAMAKGYIPNFADPLSDAIGREKEAGVPVSKIRIGSHPALMGKSNPVGLGVTNTDDEPNGLRDVFGAANGYVPNYAPTPLTYSDIGSGRSGGSSAAQAQMEKNAKQYNKSLQKLIKLFERKKLSHEQLIKGSNNLNQKYRVNANASSKVSKELNSMQGSISKAKAGLSGMNSKFAGSKVGKALDSSGGQMALMMGLPMAGGFVEENVGGTLGSAIGGALQGAGTGASMGMMFGPLGTAIGATAGALYGLTSGIEKAKDSQALLVAEQNIARQKINDDKVAASFNAMIGEIVQNTSKINFDAQANISEQVSVFSKLGKAGSGIFGMKNGETADKLTDSLRAIIATPDSKGGKAANLLGLEVEDLIDQNAVQFTRENEGEFFDFRDSILQIDKVVEGILNRTITEKGVGAEDDDPSNIAINSLNESREDLRRALIVQMNQMEGGRAIIADFYKTQEVTTSFAKEFQGFYKEAPKTLAESVAVLGNLSVEDLQGKDREGAAKSVVKSFIEKGLDDDSEMQVEIKGKIETVNKRQLLAAVEAAEEGQQLAKLLQSIGLSTKKVLTTSKGQQRAVILQLNTQKAMITAQRAAYKAQVDIKSKYLKQSNLLNSQEKMLGGLMSEEQKVRIQYNKNLLKASEAYALGAQAAVADKRAGIITDIGKDKNLQQALKQELFKDEIGKGKKYSKVKEVETADLTYKLAAMDAEELLVILKNLNISGDAANKIIENRNLLYENAIDTLKKQETLTNKRSQLERDLNMKLAERKTLMEDINREMQNYVRGLDYATQSRAMESEIASAQFRAGPDRTREEIVAEERRLVEQRKQDTIGEYVKFTASKSAKIVEASKTREDLEGLFASQGGEAEVQRLEKIAMTPAPIANWKEVNQELQELKTLQGSVNVAKEEEKQLMQDTTKKIEDQLNLTNQKISKEEKLQQIREKEYARKTGPGAFGEGIKDAGIDMEKRVAMMDYELGQRIPQAFADGLSNAMVDAINGTKSIKEGLMDAAIGFLGMIQKAMMQKMVMQAMGSMGFSQGGNVRNYSKGGNVPARVSDGEYLMSREAVNKYGGSFMHGLNAGGRAPEFASGGEVFSAGLIGGGISSKILEGKKKRQDSLRTDVENNLLSKGKIKREEGSMGAPVEQGSALAQNFGGGRGFDSGRLYQKRAMSSAFYAQSDNVGLTEDTGAMQSILSEEDHIRQMEEARRQAKKAKRKQLMNMAIGVAAQFALGKIFSGSSGPKMGLGRDTISRMPESSFDFSGVKSSPVGDFSQFGDYNYSSQLGRLYNGGPIRKYASGGHIAGKSGIDQIPAMLSEGEYVIKASSARQLGKPMLDQINAGKFQFGGEVSPINSVAESTSSGGNTNNISISVNIKKGTGEDATQVEDAKPNSEDGGPDGAQEFADKIKTQVVAVIVQEQRPGGLLFD